MCGELEGALSTLGHGDHLCLLYDTPEEQLRAAVPFIRDGLEARERCVYIVDDRTAREVCDALAETGVDVGGARDADALRLFTKRETYLRSGRFSPDGMLELLSAEADAAGSDGYEGLRATGEMTWALGEAPGSQRLIEYEARLNHLVEGSRSVILCQYDRSRFPPDTVHGVLRTHPIAVIGERVHPNPYYERPEWIIEEASPEERVEWMLVHLARSREMEERIRTDARLQGTLAELGGRALAGRPLDLFARSVLEEASRALGADFGAFARPGEGHGLRLVAGVGWEAGAASEGAGRRWVDPAASSALTTGAPVTFADLAGDARFEAPELLTAHGISAGVVAVVRGENAHRGVLAFYSRESRTFTPEETRFVQAAANLLAQAGDRERVEEELRVRTGELEERVKELRCLYDVSSLLHRNEQAFEATLRQVARRIPGGWQHPEIAETRVVLDGGVHETPGFRETPWRLEAELRVSGDVRGSVSVVYLEEPRDREGRIFLDEEDLLLGAIAERLADAVRRRESEEAIRTSEAHFRALIENAADVITLVDREGMIVEATPSVDAVLGYPPEEVEGSVAFDRVHPDDAEEVRERFDKLLDAPGSTARAGFRVRAADGEWRELDATGTNLLDDPAVEAVVVNTRDVTAQKDLEKQLLQAQKMEAVGQLAGGVAHDFNNVLTVIEGHVAFLMDDLTRDDPRRDDVEEIHDASVRAASLTRQLLAFSKRQVVRPTVLDVDEVLAGMERMLRRLIGEDIELEILARSRDGRVEMDRSQLEQVLLNLAVNAREAMPGGGRVTVETKLVVLDREYVASHAEASPGPHVVLSVSDEGRGIPREILDQVFEPFFTTKETGSGLGLATIYGIVDQAGGHVRVYSEVGRGTTFRVFLPRVGEGDDAVAEAERDRNEPRGGTETVLVVEDDDAVRELAAAALRRHGYRVLEAPDGESALQVVTDGGEAVDLLLSDVVMPGMSGTELAERVEARSPGLRVVFTSGYPDAAAVRHGVIASGTEFLEKPFVPDALARKVREVLDRGKEGTG